MKNVQAVRLDVTVPADIAAAVETVKKGGRGLYGVVNNAGVVVVAPLIEVDEKDIDFIFNVNLYGPYRITKAFAPLLFESKGRVVNISSLNGIVASPMIGAYSMSKHAIEAYGDGLAAELARFGVQRESHRAGELWHGHREECPRAHGHERVQGLAFRGADAVGAELDARVRDHTRRRTTSPTRCTTRSRTIRRSCGISSCPRRIRRAIAIRKLIDELVQLNRDQKFSYDRDALVKMLDDAIARSKQKK